MNFEYSPYILPLIAAMFVSGWSILYMWPHRGMKGIPMLILLTAGVAMWTVGYALEIAGANLATKVFWGKMQYFGITIIPVTWLFFTLTYTNPSYQLTSRFVASLIIVPLITLALALTTDIHGLIWMNYDILQEEGFSALSLGHGWWFWVYWVYAQLLVLAGTVIMVWSLIKSHGVFRGQRILFFVAVLAPWVGNLIYIIVKSSFDFTPFGFTVSVVSLAWAIFGFHLMDITPLARDLVVDSMRDGMIVLDVRGHVVDINGAAARMIGVPVSDAIGRTAGDVFQPWAHMTGRFHDVLEGRDEISVGEGEAKRRYEVRLSPLQDHRDQLVGRVVMLRAMDTDAPQPRFARSAVSATPIQPYPRDVPEDQKGEDVEKKTTTIWDALVNYFSAPVKSDIPIPGGVNPVWYRTRERIFTIIVRLAACVGLIALFFAPHTPLSVGVNLIFALLLAFLWVLGIVRQTRYELRVNGFLVLVFGFAFVETLNFGFTPESLIFFLSFVIVAAVLASSRGAIYATLIMFFTVSVFAALINSRTFIPLARTFESNYAPETGVSSLFVFAACALGSVTSVVILINNLNSAWQKETQALNLLQQERDLLEQRVEERTHALAAARDEAERISSDLRKYFRAIERSGSTVVITDADGNIEYANPMFEQSTGYTIAEIAGKNLHILKSGQQSDEHYARMWNTITTGKVWNGELLNRRKDGSLYWEYATIAPVVDQSGVITNFVAIKEDVTEQRILREQLQKQNDYLSILHQIALDLLNRRDLSDLLQVIVDRFAVLLDAPYSELMLADGRFLSVVAFTSNLPKLKGERVTREKARLSWQAYETQQPAILDDYSTWEYRSDIYDAYPMYATADFPVMAGDHCLGVLGLGRSRPGYKFTPEQIETGILFARLVALVLDNASLYESAMTEIAERGRVEEMLLNQNQYLSALQKTIFAMLQSRDVASLLTTITTEAVGLVGAQYGDIYLTDGDDLVVHATSLESLVPVGSREKKPASGLLGQVWVTMRPVVVENYSEWNYRNPSYSGWNLRAVAGIPIIGRDGPLGVLEVARMQDDPLQFTPQEIDVFEQFAALASLVLDNASLYDSARKEIAERKYAEALLQESEARFRQIVENASDFIYRTDTDGRFIYVNPSALKMMGYASEQEVLGRHFLELTTPEFRQKLKRFYDHQYISKTKSTYFEFPTVTMDGQIIWVGQNVQLIMDGEQIVGFQAVARDITQLKQAQEALALSRDQALDASRFKSQLLSRVSHELRTPLGGILGYAELLQYNAFGMLNERQAHAVNNIVESTNYLTTVVNDLLDEAQIESQSLSLYNEYFGPAELLEKAKSTISVLTKKKGLSFVTEMSPDLPGELYGDVNRLRQILVNLAGNAVKFTEKGQITIRFKRPSPVQWSIEVQDTGTGIPAEDQQSIFEPFRQVSNSITRGNRGSGLGLAITKQLVELMGGQISLESRIGEGSLFIVSLPITNAPGE